MFQKLHVRPNLWFSQLNLLGVGVSQNHRRVQRSRHKFTANEAREAMTRDAQRVHENNVVSRSRAARFCFGRVSRRVSTFKAHAKCRPDENNKCTLADIIASACIIGFNKSASARARHLLSFAGESVSAALSSRCWTGELSLASRPENVRSFTWLMMIA